MYPTVCALEVSKGLDWTEIHYIVLWHRRLQKRSATL